MVNPKKFWLIFLPIFAFSLYLFLPSLNYYFFQDDWFVLNWARTGSFSSFFNFRTDIIYWRPLSMPILFAVAKMLFGLNYQAYHALVFFILMLLIVAVYNLFLILTKDKKTAVAASFLYAIWPIHYISLSWFSTTSYIIGPLFQTLSFIFFLKYQEARKPISKILSYLLFILGLMSSEFTLVTPLIFLSWSVLLKKKISLNFVIPMLVIDTFYFILRFVIFPVPASGTYSPIFNIQIIYNYIWYCLWTIGLPESFKSLIFVNLPQQSLKVITQFWQITVPSAILSALIVYEILKNIKKNLRPYFFGVFWFSIGLLPVLTVTNHSYPNYLSFAGLGFIYIVLTAARKSKIAFNTSLIILWIIVSVTNLQFTRLTHWVRNEQALSKAYVNFTFQKAKNPPAGSAFLFKSANIKFAALNHFFLVEGEDTLRLSLNDQSAMQVVYNDSTLNSFYEVNNQKVSIPQNIQIFEISPSL